MVKRADAIAPDERAGEKRDWVSVEREYRAGQLSIREIARRHGLSATTVRRRAEALGWTRALGEQVRAAVRRRLAPTTGLGEGDGLSDAEIIAAAAQRGAEVVATHRRDLARLRALERVLTARLITMLEGGEPSGPCLGERESPGALLEKLARVTGRLIPLERQAHSLDAGPPVAGEGSAPAVTIFALPDNGRD